jgi:aminoglycoside phosphotransferase (APT) family kinase protein
MAEWDREIEIDPEAVRRAAGSPAAWRLLGAGWDCDAWIADESIVWRVPRRNVAIPSLRREAAVMPVLAPHLPNAVPVPRLVEAHGLPPITHHELIPGRELAEAGESAGLGSALGIFLRSLHAPERVRDAESILPIDPLGRADPAKRVPVAHRRLDEVAQRIDVNPLRAIVEAGGGSPLPSTAVTHGDLHVRHVLIDRAVAFSGVIDWGDCCIGAAAVDLAIVTALSRDEQTSFFEAYGEVNELTWRHARLIGVHIGAALLAAGPDEDVRRSARRWLERLASDSARVPS